MICLMYIGRVGFDACEDLVNREFGVREFPGWGLFDCIYLIRLFSVYLSYISHGKYMNDLDYKLCRY